MPVDGGALGTVVVVAEGDGLIEGDGEAVCAKATPKEIIPETPKPTAATPILCNIINFTSCRALNFYDPSEEIACLNDPVDHFLQGISQSGHYPVV